MIHIKLADILDKKDITQSQLYEITRIRPGTINAYFHSFAKRLNVKDLNKLCAALDCRIEDLIEYIPEKKKPD